MKLLIIYLWNKIKYLAELNNRYKIKLVGMLSTIFIILFGILIYIIHSKTMLGLDPLLLTIDDNSFLGRILTSYIFKSFFHFIFLPLNLGPIYEALLGLILLIFFILIFFILMSSYMKIFLIPLSILVTIIFYNLLTILKKLYTGNTIEILNKFGIVLKKNIEPPKIVSIDELLNNINDLGLAARKSALEVNKIIDWQGLDLNVLLKNLIEKEYTNWHDVNHYIVEFFQAHWNFLPVPGFFDYLGYEIIAVFVILRLAGVELTPYMPYIKEILVEYIIPWITITVSYAGILRIRRLRREENERIAAEKDAQNKATEEGLDKSLDSTNTIASELPDDSINLSETCDNVVGLDDRLEALAEQVKILDELIKKINNK